MIKILNISFYYYILFSFVFSSSIKVTKGMKYVSLSKEKIPLLLEEENANSWNSGRKEKVYLETLLCIIPQIPIFRNIYRPKIMIKNIY